MREQETRQALDDAELKSLELEAQKRLFHQVCKIGTSISIVKTLELKIRTPCGAQLLQMLIPGKDFLKCLSMMLAVLRLPM